MTLEHLVDGDHHRIRQLAGVEDFGYCLKTDLWAVYVGIGYVDHASCAGLKPSGTMH